MNTILSIFPGDKRLQYLPPYLPNYTVHFCSTLESKIPNGLVLTGTPFTKDGKTLNCNCSPAIPIHVLLRHLTPSHTLIGTNLPAYVTEYLIQHGISFLDLSHCPALRKNNSVLTAEGLLLILSEYCNMGFEHAKILLIGYGFCGHEIARVLRYSGNHPIVYEIEEYAQKEATTDGYSILKKDDFNVPFDFIINTAPGTPLTEEQWHKIPGKYLVFQIASGTLNAPISAGSKIIQCPGIPGKYAPKSAAKYMAQEIRAYQKKKGKKSESYVY